MKVAEKDSRGNVSLNRREFVWNRKGRRFENFRLYIRRRGPYGGTNVGAYVVFRTDHVPSCT